jgi:NhaP-type Na+/H+ or K+/H+ antiporter
LVLFSCGLGIVFALFTSFLFKHARFLTKNAVMETLVMFCMAWVAYLIADGTVLLNTQMSGDLT